jgi:hypothetical protein
LGGKSLTFSCIYAPKYISLGILIKQLKVMKKTNASASGTSFHGITFTASINALTSLLGEPSFTGDFSEDKVTVEWVCETIDGYIVTIYDWKEYRWIDKDERIEFHIGGRNKFETLDAKDELIDIMKTYFSYEIHR